MGRNRVGMVGHAAQTAIVQEQDPGPARSGPRPARLGLRSPPLAGSPGYLCCQAFRQLGPRDIVLAGMRQGAGRDLQKVKSWVFGVGRGLHEDGRLAPSSRPEAVKGRLGGTDRAMERFTTREADFPARLVYL